MRPPGVLGNVVTGVAQICKTGVAILDAGARAGVAGLRVLLEASEQVAGIENDNCRQLWTAVVIAVDAGISLTRMTWVGGDAPFGKVMRVMIDWRHSPREEGFWNKGRSDLWYFEELRSEGFYPQSLGL
ncbi:unnamed protein product [Tuber aestivum]|uniref:Uncharacterized protein n=1 Tax=Tuber aestivum TaxID=59557 RepID=A0A292Q0G4_9PEZI|nr:unnamed protein product [Tuber aestivum]